MENPVTFDPAASAKLEPVSAARMAIPDTEAVVRSPLGEVRVWIDEDGELKTDIRLTFEAGAEAASAGIMMRRVVDQAASASRGLEALCAPRMAAASNEPHSVQLWLQERCEAGEGLATRSLDLHDDYRAWMEARGARGKALTLVGFGLTLTKMGILSYKPGGSAGKVRVGIRLKPYQVMPAVEPAARVA